MVGFWLMIGLGSVVMFAAIHWVTKRLQELNSDDEDDDVQSN